MVLKVSFCTPKTVDSNEKKKKKSIKNHLDVAQGQDLVEGC